MKTVRRAMISVSDKEGIVDLAKSLAEQGTRIVSTGGTAAVLSEAGVPVTPVGEITGFPEMLCGRVRTLHPKVFGGILGRRSLDSDALEMEEHGITPIDLVVVNFYPFESAAARKGITPEEAIEQIDIGGPSLVRAAAKSHADVVVLCRPSQYGPFLDALRSDEGVTPEMRRRFAAEAFLRVARYDGAIADWFDRASPGETVARPAGETVEPARALRYGENPHQKAWWYSTPDQSLHLTPLRGKELSYNNLLDADGAWRLISEFDEPAAAIIKHGNPCGVAAGGALVDLFRGALACDPVSAFGGIVALNRPVDERLAKELAGLFLEVILAPRFEGDALERLARKKRLRLVEATVAASTKDAREVRSISAGMLVQEPDLPGDDEAAWTVPTRRKPAAAEIDDLRFAWKVAKHVRSNAAVLAASTTTVGIGAGQMSRVDSVRLAVEKAADARLLLDGAVMASDGFFPFPDGVERAAQAGIRAVIQPGGSIRDGEVIAAADTLGVAMVFTGTRHFRH